MDTNKIETLDSNKTYDTCYFHCIECNSHWIKWIDYDWLFYQSSNFNMFEYNYKEGDGLILNIICPHHQLEGKYWKMIEEDTTTYFYGDICQRDSSGFYGIVFGKSIFNSLVFFHSLIDKIDSIQEITQQEFLNISKHYLINNIKEKFESNKIKMITRFSLPKKELEHLSTQFHELFHETKIIGTDIIY